ncbi:hypothetical protein VZT92_026762 [Zoarces viviparus]|uniref:Uncharacterized protein n=1 Tax=Zoarces viviparus TaxID=48416 RepID=A0AAW1DSE2_ZOAVI
MSADQELNTDDDDKLVRPKVEFQTLLRDAGATKEVFTMKEVMFYLGEYIIQKKLYDQKQQYIVHCSQDALGRVLGLDSFSVKEPQALFAMIAKNLVAVKNQESPPSSSEPHTDTQTDRVTESGRSEVTVAASDSDSDNFSVEFEVESVDSDNYNEDDASLSADDQLDVMDASPEGSDVEENEGVDLPDGQRVKTPLPSQCHSDSSLSAPDSCLDPCLICLSRPKNGCIVHGRTGHLMSCYVCACKLKKRNKLCPVCRLPIQSVILTYLS